MISTQNQTKIHLDKYINSLSTYQTLPANILQNKQVLERTLHYNEKLQLQQEEQLLRDHLNYVQRVRVNSDPSVIQHVQLIQEKLVATQQNPNLFQEQRPLRDFACYNFNGPLLSFPASLKVHCGSMAEKRGAIGAIAKKNLKPIARFNSETEFFLWKLQKRPFGASRGNPRYMHLSSSVISL